MKSFVTEFLALSVLLTVGLYAHADTPTTAPTPSTPTYKATSLSYYEGAFNRGTTYGSSEAGIVGLECPYTLHITRTEKDGVESLFLAEAVRRDAETGVNIADINGKAFELKLNYDITVTAQSTKTDDSVVVYAEVNQQKSELYRILVPLEADKILLKIENNNMIQTLMRCEYNRVVTKKK